MRNPKIVPQVILVIVSRFFSPFRGTGGLCGLAVVVSIVVEVATAVGMTTFHGRVASISGSRLVWPT